MSAVSAINVESLCEGFEVPDSVKRFENVPNREVIFGCGTLTRIGSKCAELGGSRVLIVTDPGIAKTGHPLRAADSILEADKSAFIFDDVHENPTTDDVERCVEFARQNRIDLIVGLGGGSSMDTAKGCNFILTNGGEMKDYWGVDKAPKMMLPFIAVPTTSGTGSECQSFALIADAKTHAKMACGDKKAAAAVAILDPELTVTQPYAVTSHTGIDAIAHALETAVCKKRTEISSAYSSAAWHLLNSGFEKVLRSPEDIVSRAQMQLGAAFAGAAIENSMLGIAHSCANPLTAHFGIVHGQAVGVMLPHVIDFNSRGSDAAEIYQSLGTGLSTRITELLQVGGIKTRLSELKFDEAKLPQLSEEAAAQWTAQFNPVPVTASDLQEVYQNAI
ncbi:MAG: iron-containing alcohol dehydrogenase [Verrucomicrobiales bacterium]|nr:iron-containing alcohol dehydrogenase [Verrucomicrobiales bacterium]